MKVVEELGMQEYGTKGKKTRFAIYECDKCKTHTRIAVGDYKKRKHKSLCRSCANSVAKTIHGMSGELLLYVWSSIKTRCRNSNSEHYSDYGERGIDICDEWHDNCIVFKDWALSNGYKEGLEIDRKDNNKGYNPDNCRFVSHSVNCTNRRKRRNTYNTYIGVNNNGVRFSSKISMGGINIYLGTFDTAEEAAMARNLYIVENKLPHTLNVINTKENK